MDTAAPGTLDGLIDFVAAGGTSHSVLIIGQILPYIPQYQNIVQLKDSSGFSMKVPLVLLTANIMRLLFWSFSLRLGRPFGLILVVQSIVMIITQLYLLQVCLRYKKREGKTKSLIQDFWDWDEAATYCKVNTDSFLLVFWAAATALTFGFYNSAVYFEVLGCAALITEAILGVPQLLKNFRSQSTEGLSAAMIYGWTLGDTCKTFYFVKKAEPLQFVACGMIQIMVDLGILFQVFTYSKSALGKDVLR